MALGPIMLDVAGTELAPSDREILREPAVGGLILFTRNYASIDQLGELVAEARALRKPPLLIAVDYEGGGVQRFRDGFTPIPSARRIGQHYATDAGEARQIARDAARIAAAELRAVGVDLSFSPCVDLDWGVSQVIGDRAFHADAAVVTDLAAAWCRGLADAGMEPVLKHFPGHGAVAADSHERLPVDRREFGDLLEDMRPYESLLRRRLAAAVMLAHVVYSEVDEWPASLSEYWMQRQLRGELRFDGAIFSDDMSMKATAEFGRMAVRARRALEAGGDMVVICNDRSAAARAVAALADYSHPPSLVRLARLHGDSPRSFADLRASDDYRESLDRLSRWSEQPDLELGA